MNKIGSVNNVNTLSMYPHNIIDTLTGLFVYQYNALPNIEVYSSIDITSIEKKLGIEPTAFIKHHQEDEEDDNGYFNDVKLYAESDVWIYCSDMIKEDKKLISRSLYIFYYSNDELVKTYKKFIEKNNHKTAQGKISLLVQEGSHMNIRSFKLTKPSIDFALNYNDGFEDVHNKMVAKLNEKNGKGLFILHGQPGTGKTTYLKYLTHFIKSKPVIFIPANYVEALASPEFISFLMDYRDSIIIIEEAENVLGSKAGVRNQAVSNLLNITDGILGDCLNIQIIATFNTDLTNIDQALIRKGRLMSKYEFKQLTPDRASALAKSLGIDNVMSDESVSDKTTLANIYNMGENPSESSETKRIGFRQ